MSDLKAERDALRDAVVNWSIEAAELKREVERLRGLLGRVAAEARIAVALAGEGRRA